MDRFEIAPFLRGLSFDGEKSQVVVFQEKIKQPDLICSAKQLASRFKPGMRSVYIDKVGAFLLGRDYQDALEGTHLPSKFSGRAAVVEHKVCVVTGGAQGFGEKIVRELVTNGASVFIADLNLAAAQKLAFQLNKAAKRQVAFALALDVRSEDSVKKMIDHVVLTLGGIDLFISNAGVLKAASVKEMKLDDFEFVTAVNYTGFFLCVKHVAPVMERMNAASKKYFCDIIAIASKSALQGSNKNGAYAGSKFGLLGLVQSFAKELVSANIKINAVCPGNFFDGPLWSDPKNGLFLQYLKAGKVPGAKTVAEVRRYYEDQIPMGRGCLGSDLIKAIYYLIEQKYETGQALPITGGQIML